MDPAKRTTVTGNHASTRRLRRFRQDAPTPTGYVGFISALDEWVLKNSLISNCSFMPTLLCRTQIRRQNCVVALKMAGKRDF
jgi:hypothetical protein